MPAADPVEVGPTTPVARTRAATGGEPARTADRDWFTSPDAEVTLALPLSGSAAAGSATARSAAASPDTEQTTAVIHPGPLRPGPPPARAGDATESPTERIPLAAAATHPAGTQLTPDSPTAPTPAGPTPPPGDGNGGAPRQPRRHRRLLLAAAALALLGLLYVADLALSSGSVPRGTTVAGVSIGGLGLTDAEARLRAEIEPRIVAPVTVTAGDVTTELDPTTAGLAVDWDATLDRASVQPLNPITRITSFFTESEIGVTTAADDAAVDAALEQLVPVVDRAPTEGTVRFEGTTPVAVDPVAGQQLDLPAANQVLRRDWAFGTSVVLPLIPVPAVTTPEDVAAAITEVAEPAVSGPVTILGEQESEGVLEPEAIAAALSFEPGAQGGLEPVLNPTVVTDALTPQLAGSEREPRDAELDFSTTPPSVIPSQDGRGVDYEATAVDLLAVLTEPGPREITAVYADQPADLTTEELEALGVAGEISSFQTGGFATDSGMNIRRAAELVNGTVVQPGETFSLDQVTGPRTAANGYIEAGVIDQGRPGRGIAGGVSQVSTTVFNAAYFAGMTDVEHTPHSFYIGRYPPGREATIATGAIDMQFRNDTPTAILIRTAWTPTSITVTIFGTKYYEVTSATGPRTNPTQPNTVTIPAGEPCNPGGGAPGFTITDTRTLRNLQTGEVTVDPTRTTRYNPSPQIVCGT